jgi:uncharacterized membrane protein YkvA (DUF1232 family)
MLAGMSVRPSLAHRMRAWAARLKRDGMTLWFAVRHPATPWHARALMAFVVAYALSPIDLIPDFIPVLGYLDDVLLLPALIWLALRLTPDEVIADCRRQADAWSETKRAEPRSIGGIVLVAAAWFCCALALWCWLIQPWWQGRHPG